MREDTALSRLSAHQLSAHHRCFDFSAKKGPRLVGNLNFPRRDGDAGVTNSNFRDNNFFSNIVNIIEFTSREEGQSAITFVYRSSLY